MKVEGKPIADKQIPDLLAKVKAANPDFDVVVSADENVPHGKMILTTLYENAEMMERLLGAKTTVSTMS